MEQSELTREAALAAVRGAAIGIFSIGWGPQEWSYVFIGTFAATQTAYLLWKWHCERADRKKKGA